MVVSEVTNSYRYDVLSELSHLGTITQLITNFEDLKKKKSAEK